MEWRWILIYGFFYLVISTVNIKICYFLWTLQQRIWKSNNNGPSGYAILKVALMISVFLPGTIVYAGFRNDTGYMEIYEQISPVIYQILLVILSVWAAGAALYCLKAIISSVRYKRYILHISEMCEDVAISSMVEVLL